ncbi:MAG: FKBP-type peptidyl-prolyl cis-trans isomerase [Candidatus Odinarchaeia archaeon]
MIKKQFINHALDEEFEKMKVGEEKTVEIPPEKAFGKRDPNAIKTLPLREFKKQKIKPYPGMRLKIGQTSALVKTVSSGRVTLDFNMPLAGKTLIYTVKVTEKLTEDIDKIKALIGWRVGDPEILNEFKLDLKGSKLSVEIPEKAFLSEGLQYAKRGIARDIYKYIPKVKLVTFIENYPKESLITSSS